MALAPFDPRIQVSKYRTISGTERSVYQPKNNDGRNAIWGQYSSGQYSSVSLANLLACRRSALPYAPYQELTEILSGWMRQLIEQYLGLFNYRHNNYRHKCKFFILPSGLIAFVEWVDPLGGKHYFDDLVEFHRSFEISKLLDYVPWIRRECSQKQGGISSYRRLESQSLGEDRWRLDDTRIDGTRQKVEKIARLFRLKLARVLEQKAKIGSVASQKRHIHPGDILTCRITDDDVGPLSNDPLSRKSVERWKVGPGRTKAWRSAPHLRFENRDAIRLFGSSHQRKANFRSRPMPVQDSELIPLIKKASISSGIPIVMLEHSMVDRYRSQMFPKPSAVKKLARRLGIHASNMSRPWIRSKHMADKLINSNGDDSVGVDIEEDFDDSFEPGPLYGNFEADVFSGMGDAV